MKREDLHEDDFEPVELGSVSEETKGIVKLPQEADNSSFTSRN